MHERLLDGVRFIRERLADEFRTRPWPLGIRAALDDLENFFSDRCVCGAKNQPGEQQCPACLMADPR